MDNHNLNGWWTIKFYGYGDECGILCKLIKDKNYTSNDNSIKYILEIMKDKFIDKYGFKNAEFIIKDNKILKWDTTVSADKHMWKEELGEDIHGSVSLNGRFISVYSKTLEKKFETKSKHKDQLELGMFCLIEKMEMINKTLEYLIIIKKNKSNLVNKYRKTITKLKNNSDYQIDIIYDDEILNKGYIIKNLLVYNTLYVKLPKSQIMTLHQEWQGDYLDEQMNELIQIFRFFNANTIKYTITKQKNEIKKKSYGLGLNLFSKSVSAKNSKETNKSADTSLEYKIVYNKSLKEDEINDTVTEALYQFNTSDDCFPKRDLNFFYFWKHPEWKSQMEHRTIGKCTSMDFVHEEKINNTISKSFASSLDKINISFDKSASNTLSYKIVFNITYFD